MAVPLPPRPSSTDGFYSINNQFQLGGPKGYTEFTTLEKNLDVFVRLDFPGVPEEGMTVFLHKSKKSVIIKANAPKVHEHDSSHRSYITSVPLELICKCCIISSFTSHVSDGVLRLLISKTGIDPHQPSCLVYLRRGNPEDRRFRGSDKFHGTDPQDPKLTGPVLQPHPNVLEGSNVAYESKQLGDGKLYVRVDMPGVPKENFTVSVTNGRVNVTGLAPAVSHDSSGRFYHGDVAMLPTNVNIPARRIKTIAKNGVIRLLIPSV